MKVVSQIDRDVIFSQIELFAEHILEMERKSGTQLLTDEERNFATT